MRKLIPFLCALFLLGRDGGAQSVVVPYPSAAARGSAGSSTLASGFPRTYMLGVSASELTGIPAGAVINGVSFRSNAPSANPATWPPSDTTWPDYEVTVGNSIPLTTWTGTFATNFTGTPVMVRDGPMLIEANTFKNDTNIEEPYPNVFGDFFWDFQNTFTYTGGDLGILFTLRGARRRARSCSTASGRTPHPASASRSPRSRHRPVPPPPVSSRASTMGTARDARGPGTFPNLVQTSNVSGGGSVRFVLANAPAGTVAICVIGTGATSTRSPMAARCSRTRCCSFR